MNAAAPRLKPNEIFEDLRRAVIGQDEALREVSVTLVKHLIGQAAENILLIGNSGSGKTTIMRAVEQLFTARPDLAHFSNVVRINANVLAEEHENAAGAVLGRLYRNAQRKLGADAAPERIVQLVERGVVFVDEVDKIRAHVGGEANVKGIVAQEALLTLIENEAVELEIDGRSRSINSSSILFVAGGAFEDLYDSVLRRAMTGSDVAPIRPVVVVSQTGDVREELPFHLRSYLRYEDLFKYGMTPQFISRFESIIVLNDLTEIELATIFAEPEGSIFRVSREYFRQFDVDLQITRAAVRAIAWEASRQKRLGARALKEAYRRIIRSLEFEPDRARFTEAPDGRRVVTIDEQKVKEELTR